MWYILLCVYMNSPECIHEQKGTVSVVTSVGDVQGNEIFEGDETFNEFLGIPYADVDENDPFGPAIPYPNFDTPYSATNDHIICPQIVERLLKNEAGGNIHCLRLNIYTPNNATQNSTLPVMVYIHGGDFVKGSGSLKPPLSPRYLVRNNVILVTVNYRLGPYGFLCLPQLGYSNQGLKDIVLALKWIKDHINSFGGDEDNILLFGHSSGSMLVDAILLYNEDNVFNKVILQSGQIISPFAIGEPTTESYVATIAEKLGIQTEKLNIGDSLKQLSNVTTVSIINVTKSDQYRPCIDNIFITKSTKNINMINKGILIGTTEKEMLHFYGSNTNNLDKFKQELDKGFTDLPEDAVDMVKNFYLNGYVIDFGTDLVFNYPIERSMLFYIANNASVYRYVLSNLAREDRIEEMVPATHGDDLKYIFGLDIIRYTGESYDDKGVMKLVELWTAFAKDSSMELWNEVSNHKTPWPTGTKESHHYMDINLANNLSIREGPHRDRMDFWDAFYKMYYTYVKGIDLGQEYTTDGVTVSGEYRQT